MRVLALQSCGFQHYLAAVAAVHARFARVTVVGFVRPGDVERAVASGRFAVVRTAPTELTSWASEQMGGEKFDLCLVPFESRLGIYYWQIRRVPIQLGIPRVMSYNRLGRSQVSWRMLWLVKSLVACVLVRAVHTPSVWAWRYLRQWLDVAGLFSLAGMALVLRVLRMGLTRVLLCPSGSEGGDCGRRLALFIPSLGMGGAQRQLVSFLAHLDRSRWEPEVVTLDMPDKFFEGAVRAQGVPIQYLNAQSDYWMCGVVWRLTRYLRRRPCLVLHGWLHYAAMLGSIAGALAGVPAVVGSFRSERPGLFPWFYPKWQRGIDILTARLHDLLIANSDAVRRENRRWALVRDRQFVTIYNGIDIEEASSSHGAACAAIRSSLQIPHDVPLIGIVGRLSPEKDHGTFLRAARTIHDGRPDARFVIVGDGPMRSRIEADIAQLGLNEAVSLLGERAEAKTLIGALDVLVMTSTSEGLPNVLIEGAAAGIPVVTTRAGGAAEVVEEDITGYVVACGDHQAVADRVLRLVNDQPVRTRMAKAARVRAKAAFSAEAASAAIQGCYAELDDNGRRPNDVEPPLHVCFVSPLAYRMIRGAASQPIGGAEVQVVRLASELMKDGRFGLSVLTSDDRRRGRERWGQLQIWLSDLFGHDRRSGSQAPEVGTSGHTGAVPSSGRLLRHLHPVLETTARWFVHRAREVRELIRWLMVFRMVGADIYVMRCASPQVAYARVASRLLGKQFVYMIAHDDEVSGEYLTRHGLWGRRFEWGLTRADDVICQHHGQLEWLRDRFGRSGRLIRSLCPVEPSRYAEKPRRHVLWMARLDDWKQPSLFLDLAARLTEESFVMVGPRSGTDPADSAALKARIDALPNLRFEPGVPFSETRELFETAKVFVSTSQAEGFPNTFLQAAACGTPIVSWQANPDQFLNRHEVGICAEGSWARFEEAVRALCRDSARRAQFGRNGQRYVQTFHAPAHIAGQYADLFLELSSGCRARSAGKKLLPELGKQAVGQ